MYDTTCVRHDSHSSEKSRLVSVKSVPVRTPVVFRLNTSSLLVTVRENSKSCVMYPPAKAACTLLQRDPSQLGSIRVRNRNLVLDPASVNSLLATEPNEEIRQQVRLGTVICVLCVWL